MKAVRACTGAYSGAHMVVACDESSGPEARVGDYAEPPEIDSPV